MPPFLTAKTMGLPRWAWAAMLAGGVVIGLYFRSHNHSEHEPESESAEGYLNSGNLMPPAAPIEGGGGSGGGGAWQNPVLLPVVDKPESPKVELAPSPESPTEVELPESRPPPEQIIETGGNSPKETPGGRHEPIRGETIGGPKIGENKPVAPPPNKQEREKIQNEINRLQGEIQGLQSHIDQLTNAIQSHPNAKQRGQWESERNQDRANIEHKRSEIYYWSAQ